MNSIPKWLKKKLSLDSFERVEQAIEKAESNTSAEIVPLIVRSSSTSGHVPLLLSLFLFMMYLLLSFGVLHNGGSVFHLAIVFILVSLISGLLSQWHGVQRFLIPKEDQRVQVERRALLEFYQSHMHKTQDSTGVLIMVSLMERQAVVLADPKMAQNFPKDYWSEVVQILIQGIKTGDLSQGFVRAIEKVGAQLSEKFPISHNDTNEIRNHLLIKE